jgi:hypothetical protein
MFELMIGTIADEYPMNRTQSVKAQRTILWVR